MFKKIMLLSITLLTVGNVIAADFSREYSGQLTPHEFKAIFDADRKLEEARWLQQEKERKDVLKAELEAVKKRLAMIEKKKARPFTELSVAERIAAFEKIASDSLDK